MRIYEYRCNECGAELEAARMIEQRRTHAPVCCGKPTQIEIRTPRHGYVDNMEEYLCPVTRQGVTTRRQRNEIMAREGLVDANDFLRKDEDRYALAEKKRLERERLAEQKKQTPKEVTEVALQAAMRGY